MKSKENNKGILFSHKKLTRKVAPCAVAWLDALKKERDVAYFDKFKSTYFTLPTLTNSGRVRFVGMSLCFRMQTSFAPQWGVANRK